MKTFVFLLTSCFMALFLWNESNAEETIIVGFFALEPHIYMEADGIIRGSAVEYWEKYLAPEMHATVKWKGPLPYARLLEMLRNGEVHAGIILGKTPERMDFLDYPDTQFYSAVPTLVVKHAFPLKEIRSLDDLIKLKICYVAGGYLSPGMRDPRLTIENVTHSDWADANLKKLVNDRCDAIFFPELNTARYYKHKLGLQDQVKELVLPDERSVFYTAFSKKSGKAWFTIYQQARENIKTRITYSSITDRYASGDIPLP